MNTIILDFTGIKSYWELHEYFKEVFRLPDYYGHNMDALWDCLYCCYDVIGIRETLSQNSEYANVTEAEAIRLCINDKVSDGKGMGFGLYSTSRLIKNAGVNMIICSGSKEMNFDGKEFLIKEVPFWQGTVVYFELESNKQIDPNEVVESRTDCESQFNDTFLGNEELDNLW